MAARTTCQACCPRCGMHFAGERAFELHLGGPGADPPWSHHDPRDVLRRDRTPRLVVKTREGECRLGGDLQQPVTIWQEAAAAEYATRMAAERAALAPEPIPTVPGAQT